MAVPRTLLSSLLCLVGFFGGAFAQIGTPDGCFRYYPNFGVQCATPFERRSAVTERDCQDLCTSQRPRCQAAEFRLATGRCDLFLLPLQPTAQQLVQFKSSAPVVFFRQSALIPELNSLFAQGRLKDAAAPPAPPPPSRHDRRRRGAGYARLFPPLEGGILPAVRRLYDAAPSLGAGRRLPVLRRLYDKPPTRDDPKPAGVFKDEDYLPESDGYEVFWNESAGKHDWRLKHRVYRDYGASKPTPAYAPTPAYQHHSTQHIIREKTSETYKIPVSQVFKADAHAVYPEPVKQAHASYQPVYKPSPQPVYRQPVYHQPTYKPHYPPPQQVYHHPKPKYHPKPQPKYHPKPQPKYHPKPQPKYHHPPPIHGYGHKGHDYGHHDYHDYDHHGDYHEDYEEHDDHEYQDHEDTEYEHEDEDPHEYEEDDGYAEDYEEHEYYHDPHDYHDDDNDDNEVTPAAKNGTKKQKHKQRAKGYHRYSKFLKPKFTIEHGEVHSGYEYHPGPVVKIHYGHHKKKRSYDYHHKKRCHGYGCKRKKKNKKTTTVAPALDPTTVAPTTVATVTAAADSQGRHRRHHGGGRTQTAGSFNRGGYGGRAGYRPPPPVHRGRGGYGGYNRYRGGGGHHGGGGRTCTGTSVRQTVGSNLYRPTGACDGRGPLTTRNPFFTTQSPFTRGPPLPDEVQCPPGTSARFLQTEGVMLRESPGQRASTFTARDQEECLDACAENRLPDGRQAACLSLNFDPSSGSCRLTTAAFPPLGDAEPQDPADQGVPEMTYFEKTCVNSQDSGSCPGPYLRAPQRVLIGYATQVLSADSIDQCLDFCLRSEGMDGLRCNSAMFFFDEDEFNCILNEETKDTIDSPDLFAPEEQESVDYYELNCGFGFKRTARLLNEDSSQERLEQPLRERSARPKTNARASERSTGAAKARRGKAKQRSANLTLLSAEAKWGPWSACQNARKVRFRNCQSSAKASSAKACKRQVRRCATKANPSKLAKYRSLVKNKRGRSARLKLTNLQATCSVGAARRCGTNGTKDCKVGFRYRLPDGAAKPTRERCPPTDC